MNNRWLLIVSWTVLGAATLMQDAVAQDVAGAVQKDAIAGRTKAPSGRLPEVRPKIVLTFATGRETNDFLGVATTSAGRPVYGRRDESRVYWLICDGASLRPLASVEATRDASTFFGVVGLSGGNYVWGCSKAPENKAQFFVHDGMTALETGSAMSLRRAEDFVGMAAIGNNFVWGRTDRHQNQIQWFLHDGKSAVETDNNLVNARGIGQGVVGIAGLANGNFVYGRNDGGLVQWFINSGTTADELAANLDGRGVGQGVLNVIGLADGNFVYARNDNGVYDFALHSGTTADELAFADNVRGVGTFLAMVPLPDGSFVYAREDQGKIDLFQYDGTTLDEIAANTQVCNAEGFEAIAATWLSRSDDTLSNRAAVLHPLLYKRMNADKILQTPPPHNTRIDMHRGAPRIFVDNHPITGLGWGAIKNQNQSDDTIKDMSQRTGFPCYRIVVGLGHPLLDYSEPTWLAPDFHDFSFMDRQIARVLRQNPDTYIILLVQLDGSYWWVRAHPDAAGDASVAEPDDPRKALIPDYLSREWVRDSRELIRQLVAHVQTSPYKDAVIGYELFNGESLDCNFEVNMRTLRAVQRFRDLLKDRYGTDAAIQEAWQDPSVTLDTAMPYKGLGGNPWKLWPPEEKSDMMIIVPAGQRQLIDSRDYYTWAYWQVIGNFAKAVKEATQHRAIVGARAGSLFCGAWTGPSLARLDRIGEFLKIAEIDFLDQWEPYPGRGLGLYGGGAPINPHTCLALAGKLLMRQDDVRTHTGPDRGFGATNTPAETLVKQRRVFLNALALGLTPYLWQMSYRFNTPELMKEWPLQQDIFQRALNTDFRSDAEVAYVCDPEATRYFGSDYMYSEPTSGFALYEYPRFLWARAGAPYDMIGIDQLEEAPPYKVYVFFHTIQLSEERREMIHQVLQANGAVGIFLWADGVIDAAGEFNPAAMSQLVGMSIGASRKARTWKMNASGWFRDEMGLADDAAFGVLQHYEDYDRDAANKVFSPSFTVDDPLARTMASYLDTERTGVALKQQDGWTSIYSASANLHPSVIRYALKLTGGFQYTSTENLCYINHCFVGFHTQQDGRISLKLPEATALYDVYNEHELPRSREFSLPVDKMNTYLFFRGSKQQWESLKQS